MLESLIGLAVVLIMATVLANLPGRSRSGAAPRYQRPDPATPRLVGGGHLHAARGPRGVQEGVRMPLPDRWR